MKKLFVLFISFFLLSCSNGKRVYWCGDHACVNKKEKEAYFAKTMTVEIRELTKSNKKSKSEIDLIKKQIELENKITNTDYSKFNLRVDNIKKTTNLLLENIKKAKKKIIGYGAATKGNIVLNHCDISSDKIPLICDENEEKFGRYTPGSNIKIISKKVMRRINPDYLLVMIWSFKSEVIKQEMKYIKKGGKLIFHLPFLHIVDKSNYIDHLNENFEAFSYK